MPSFRDNETDAWVEEQPGPTVRGAKADVFSAASNSFRRRPRVLLLVGLSTVVTLNTFLRHKHGKKKPAAVVSGPTGAEELQGTPSSLQTHISVGGGVMMQTEVPDTSRVFVDVGLGFKVECSIEDGLRISGLRQAAAQEQMNACAMEAAKIQATFKG
ncbi:g8100 [Coccomyxa elongata]